MLSCSAPPHTAGFGAAGAGGIPQFHESTLGGFGLCSPPLWLRFALHVPQRYPSHVSIRRVGSTLSGPVTGGRVQAGSGNGLARCSPSRCS